MFRGSYPMHKHTNEDELFYVFIGKITINLEQDKKITLNQGEMAMIPRGMNHSPFSEGDSFVLMFEPLRLKSSGD
ncbi:MAG: cupin domain-containing protein [Candidatus Hodarchaeota archaeon]